MLFFSMIMFFLNLDGYSRYGCPEVRQLHERPLWLSGYYQQYHYQPHQQGQHKEPHLLSPLARIVTKVI